MNSLTRKQYNILHELYHELNEVYRTIPVETQRLFMDYLYCRKEFTD